MINLKIIEISIYDKLLNSDKILNLDTNNIIISASKLLIQKK